MFAAVCKIVTTEKCTIIQTAGVVSYITSSVMACICYFVHYQQVAHNKGLLSNNILLNKLFTDVAPYVSICVFCLVEKLVTTEGIGI